MPQEQYKKLAEGGCPVFYFYSTEPYLVRQEAAAACAALLAGESETTVLDEAAPPLEAIVMAAGTISFFGTKRLIEIPNLEPAAYSDKDLDEFLDILSSAENAAFVLSSTVKTEWGKPVIGKRMQRLIEHCRKIGFVKELSKPTGVQLEQLLIDRAARQGTNLPQAVVQNLIETCGDDPFLLENEVDKLCAVSGYQTVSQAMVAQVCTRALEADVFDMIRLVTIKNSTGACLLLQRLLRQGNEPVNISGALIGSYVDMYRVKLGQASKHTYTAVHKDYGYKGSPYRLKHSLDAAGRYTLPQLETCIQILEEADKSLKGSPLMPATVLETALCQLAAAGRRI